MAKDRDDDVDDTNDEPDDQGGDERQEPVDDTDDLVEGLKRVRAGEEDVDIKPEGKPAKDKKPDEDEKPDDGADDDEPDAAKKAEDGAAKKKADDEKKPEVAKGLAAIAREEKRVKGEIAAERAKLAEDRQTWTTEKAKHDTELTEYRSLKQRARQDPLGAMKAMGFAESDYATVARVLWGVASKDPALKQQADEALKANELRVELDGLRTRDEAREKEIQQLRDEKKQGEENAKAATARAQYVDELAESMKAVPAEKYPLFAHFAKTNKGAAADTYELAVAWFKANKAEQRGPTFEELCDLAEKALDQHYDAEYKAFITKKKDPKETSQKKADEERTAKTLKNQHAARTSPRTQPKSEDELEAELAADIKAGKHLDA